MIQLWFLFKTKGYFTHRDRPLVLITKKLGFKVFFFFFFFFWLATFFCIVTLVLLSTLFHLFRFFLLLQFLSKLLFYVL